MQFRRIGFPNRGGNATLRVSGIRFTDFCFRQNENATGRREIQRCAQPRCAAANNDEVRINSFASLVAGHFIKMA
jgi:hypothetical protein